MDTKSGGSYDVKKDGTITHNEVRSEALVIGNENANSNVFIAGVTVAVLLLLAAIYYLGYFFFNRHRRGRDDENHRGIDDIEFYKEKDSDTAGNILLPAGALVAIGSGGRRVKRDSSPDVENNSDLDLDIEDENDYREWNLENCATLRLGETKVRVEDGDEEDAKLCLSNINIKEESTGTVTTVRVVEHIVSSESSTVSSEAVTVISNEGGETKITSGYWGNSLNETIASSTGNTSGGYWGDSLNPPGGESGSGFDHSGGVVYLVESFSGGGGNSGWGNNGDGGGDFNGGGDGGDGGGE